MNRSGTDGQDNDGDLMARIVAGDTAALETLYARHSRAVFALLFRIVGDRQTAEDLLQEAFLRAWQHAGVYREAQGRVLPWLLGVAHHLALNEHRRRRRRPQVAFMREGSGRDELREPDHLMGITPDPSDEVWERIRGAQVSKAMAALPEQQRAIIALYATGHSQSEIASRLNEPLGTVKSRMRRGLLHLRHLLEADGIGMD